MKNSGNVIQSTFMMPLVVARSPHRRTVRWRWGSRRMRSGSSPAWAGPVTQAKAGRFGRRAVCCWWTQRSWHPLAGTHSPSASASLWVLPRRRQTLRRLLCLQSLLWRAIWGNGQSVGVPDRARSARASHLTCHSVGVHVIHKDHHIYISVSVCVCIYKYKALCPTHLDDFQVEIPLWSAVGSWYVVDDISRSDGCTFFRLKTVALHVEATCALEPIILQWH